MWVLSAYADGVVNIIPGVANVTKVATIASIVSVVFFVIVLHHWQQMI
jgi:hypothetical protein